MYLEMNPTNHVWQLMFSSTLTWTSADFEMNNSLIPLAKQSHKVITELFGKESWNLRNKKF